jgi:deoxyribose-phosphate aldolase
MYKELSICDKSLTDKEAIEYLFVAAQHNFGGVSASSYFLPRLKDVLPHGMVLACPINYPDGNGDFQLTQHAIISAQRKGANAIDLVLNPHYIINNRLDNLLDETKCYYKMCHDYGITLRIMLEYRAFDSKQIMETVDILVDLDIDYIFPSTGFFADDVVDNITICKLINKRYPFLNLITTGHVWRKDQYQKVQDSGLFGLRLYNTSILSTIGV